jgi:hypothetical protein
MSKTRFDIKHGFTVAVDFDGTCVTHEYPEIGRDIGAVPVLRRLVDAGCRLILWTMRSDDKLEAAVRWFQENDLPLFGIQRNPEQDWSSSPKAYAHLYIDDAALGIPLFPGQNGERPYVDWSGLERLLFDPVSPARWETFCDASYYHLWCVRRAGDRRFGSGFHVNDSEEALELVRLLNASMDERTSALLVTALEAAEECLALVADAGHAAHEDNVTIAREIIASALAHTYKQR